MTFKARSSLSLMANRVCYVLKNRRVGGKAKAYIELIHCLIK